MDWSESPIFFCFLKRGLADLDHEQLLLELVVHHEEQRRRPARVSLHGFMLPAAAD
jgi:hypothetical protein